MYGTISVALCPDSQCLCTFGVHETAILHFVLHKTLMPELDWVQIDTSFASWRDCVSIAWVSGATGSGISRVLRRITELIPVWSTVPTTLELNAWRHKMAVGLAGVNSYDCSTARKLCVCSVGCELRQLLYRSGRGI